MSSSQEFVDFIVDQIDSTEDISFRKMFGEYALYSHGKVVALICEDQLFVKPTDGGRVFIGDVTEAPPYPGAKMYFLIGDKYDNRKWLSELIRITAKEAPLSKKKTKKQVSSKKPSQN